MDSVFSLPRVLLCAALLLLAAWSARAQLQASQWYFGNGAGLDFRSGTPQPLTNGAMVAEEGCSSRCDEQGNLLLYTNGQTIWNRLHQPMANGTGLGLPNGFPVSQVLVVPQPGNPQRYYIFTPSNDAWSPMLERKATPMYYSVVDMSRQGGLGEVVQKNTELLAKANEPITAVRHANGRDLWIIVLQANSFLLHAYLLTPAGLQATPVTSTDGYYHEVNMFTRGGQFKVSPSGRRLAYGTYGTPSATMLLDFDPTTGQVSNPVRLPRPAVALTTPGSYGLEFSPDGTKLYTTDITVFRLYQYDLTVPGFNVAASFIPTAPPTPTRTALSLDALQLGPDGRIYIAWQGQTNLGVINQPNLAGAACDFVRSGVALSSRSSRRGLPYYLPHELWRLPAPGGAGAGGAPGTAPGTICQGSALPLSFPAFYAPDSVRWDFGDPAAGPANFSTLVAPTHTYAVAGSYTIRLTLYFAAAQQVLTSTVQVLPRPVADLGPDRSLCPGSSYTLGGPALPGHSYRWQDNSTASTLTARAPGWYWLAVTNAAGCTVLDSVRLSALPGAELRLGADTVLCQGTELTLRPRLASAGLRYRWQDNSTQETLTVRSPGLYWLEATNAAGCLQRDSIRVVYLSPPAIALGPDTVLCAGTPLLLDASLPGVRYRWQDGSTGPTFRPTGSGLYWVTVTASGCSATDSIRVRIYDCQQASVFVPNVITPNHDGQNDQLRIVGLGSGIWRLTVFSRWGQLVYHSADYRQDWDAEGLAAGLYYYLLQRGNEPSVKGWVEVIR